MTLNEYLGQLRQILDARDCPMDPAIETRGSLEFRNLPDDARAEIGQTTMQWVHDGTMQWIYGGIRDAEQAARITLALLDGDPSHLTASGQQRPAEHGHIPEIADETARLLGTAVATLPVNYSYRAGEVYPELLAGNPADRTRGIVRITDDEVIWQFCPATPTSPGLTPGAAADAISAALDQAISGKVVRTGQAADTGIP